jgi:hypothetical protein
MLEEFEHKPSLRALPVEPTDVPGEGGKSVLKSNSIPIEPTDVPGGRGREISSIEKSYLSVFSSILVGSSSNFLTVSSRRPNYHMVA